ncbi:MAG: hypothetical protein IKE02_00800 [Lachnospiraceae bacterium]|nr:hypothetical protein [Lachnospiraceae bacterium]MBQ6312111.1 hypothetical protein [Lachnospiraceae bacterium]MBR2752246.1 hypothetical protein [Lachnospiraceae bacterium]
MACFLVPAAEAVATSIAKIEVDKKEAAKKTEQETKIPFSTKLSWLRNMLWGGAVLLAFEHVWHGEVVPYFPFLTAASNPADKAEMLHEMATVGVTMAVIITVVWVCMLAVASVFEKRAKEDTSAKA